MKKAIRESMVNTGGPVETYNMKTAMFLQLNLFGFLRKSLVIPMVMASKWRNLKLVSFMCYILLIGSSYSETDTLLQGQQLKYGGRLVSSFGNFRLTFFPRGDNIGIWYGDSYPYQYSRSVWYALPHKQINGSAILTIGRDRNLMILRSGGDPIAITSVQGISGHTSATLLDSGNFVLRELNIDGSVKRVLWQSFDYPTDTLLPGMKLGMNYLTGRKWSLTAGSFTFGLDSTINGTRRLVIWWAGDVYWTSRNWTNESASFGRTFPYKFEYYSNENEKYFTYHVNDNSIATARITINRDGILSISEGPQVSCGYGTPRIGCVAYPECREIYDFDPKWGVVSGNGSIFNESLAYCRQKCLRDCSCVAYAATNWIDETGCQILSDVTIDTTRPGDAQPIYVIQTKEKKRLKIVVVLILTASSLFILCLLIWRLHKDYATITDAFLPMLTRLLQIWRRSKEKSVEYLHSMKRTDTEQEILLHELGIDRRQNHSRHERNSHELLFFSFESIVSATTNFAPINKLGEGGFGPVYKGKFPDGLEVAIKRLSTNSRQGLVEFKNEVKVIAKLQHNNLVRLLGCCIEREEKLLIYEYMPNKSLDFFLFDPTNKSSLDWKTRFNIIEGIAQGLLYLHKYSRLKIIHRDLKASNVLLGSDMNPKISDFGMAKIFGSDESKANTNRVVGTYGYMPPEYAFEGIFSTKSDVFSYGVLLLEITSGRRNNSFHDADGPLNLVVHAWELWKQGQAREMIDSTINDEFRNEVLRCIHIGLLCTQENPMDRPAMLDVTSMLYNDAYQLPSPQKPAFYRRRNLQDAEIAGQKQEQQSVNEASITEMEAR